MNVNTKKSAISIVVPLHNEEESLPFLIERIVTTMRTRQVEYEVVLVDDFSTDKTSQIAKKFSNENNSIHLVNKPDSIPKGKAHALLYGFKHARYPIIAMIDADLQYPPEVIPDMMRLINGGAGVVVGERKGSHKSYLRRVASKIFRFGFGRILHGFSVDIQSGLKIFKREIIERVTINPSAWMFDLVFLLAARDAGYKLASFPIRFSARRSGTEKVTLLSNSIKMALDGFVLKFRNPHPIRFHPESEKKKGKGFHYNGREYVHHSDLSHFESAFFPLSAGQKIGLIILLAGFILGVVYAFHPFVIVFLAILTILYFTDLLFTAFLYYRSLRYRKEVLVSREDVKKLDERTLPTYTVFCPLYKEWSVLNQFMRAMSQLDYPKNKLQVMLLLESDDKESIDHVAKMTLPSFFEVYVIPDANPKTKPKALNYGLQFAKGDYVVIYDAEDVPEPHQLKKAILAFSKLPSQTICLQAKLNFYNPHQNLMTKMFTVEYSLWFDLTLPGLQSINAPIPLGGTSNHFKISLLKEIGGWDTFNVTEDCDLGMRLAKRHYRTAILDSYTLEEANSRFFNWIRQRSRWIKGYMQTYLVHSRDIRKFSLNRKNPDAFVFQIVVGGKILSMFINPFMWTVTISYFALRPIVGQVIESFYPAPILYMGVVCLVFGNFLYLYSYMIASMVRRQYSLVKFAYLAPVYWLMMSFSAWVAIFDMLVRPYYWSKTIHGFHISSKGASKVKLVRLIDHPAYQSESSEASISPFGSIADFLDYPLARN